MTAANPSLPPTPPLHPTLSAVTERIRTKSAATRSAYLAEVTHYAARQNPNERMGCANIAHAVAAMPDDDKNRYVGDPRLAARVEHTQAPARAPHVAIVSSYNDMLSAHAPLQSYPDLLKAELRTLGATAQMAGGVPAMCDGVTQGQPGMELSLLSRDVIAMSTAVALTHDVFDAALLLGVCDKIVPGLLIGALQFGHLPCVFVPAGPMTSGISNAQKAKVRERAAQGLATQAELLQSEMAAYHGLGTCTFYGTANSNQMLLEAMGLHVPGTAFVQPAGEDGGELRGLLTRQAAQQVLSCTAAGGQFKPIGHVVDERCIVNAMVALLATGGSTNHLIHWVAVAKAAGILIDWDDFAQLSEAVPLLTRVYPNGQADVNDFQAAGGPGVVIRELLAQGLMHADVLTVASSLHSYTQIPTARSGQLVHEDAPNRSQNESCLRTFHEGSGPFSTSGGLALLKGNLGRSVIKVSAVAQELWCIEAPCFVAHSQDELQAAYKAGLLNRDVVCVVRFQGPKANGMPELHKLTPPLAVLQGKGFKVALVTDGRMSGASGKVPAAIHCVPEAADGGPLAKLRTGDVVRVDAKTGELTALVPQAEWEAREAVSMPAELRQLANHGLGRMLTAKLRQGITSAEEGACTW